MCLQARHTAGEGETARTRFVTVCVDNNLVPEPVIIRKMKSQVLDLAHYGLGDKYGTLQHCAHTLFTVDVAIATPPRSLRQARMHMFIVLLLHAVDRMVAAVAAGLAAKNGVPCVLHLNVRNNRLTGPGVAALLTSAQNIPGLLSVDLSENLVPRRCISLCTAGANLR